MTEIKWSDSFSINNSEIDDQHKKWIEILNILHENILAGKGTQQQKTEALKAMHEYTQKHFSFEEEYMRKIGYPDLIKHRRIHKDFDNLIFSHIRDIEKGEIVLGSSIIKLIKNWLFDHILFEDKKFAIFSGEKM